MGYYPGFISIVVIVQGQNGDFGLGSGHYLWGGGRGGAIKREGVGAYVFHPYKREGGNVLVLLKGDTTSFRVIFMW